jgi:hypothetical protein
MRLRLDRAGIDCGLQHFAIQVWHQHFNEIKREAAQMMVAPETEIDRV